MARRKTKNKTGISRIEGIPYHDAWISFSCIKCYQVNYLRIGQSLLNPSNSYQEEIWECKHCGFIHSKDADIPFANWANEYTLSESVTAERFWEAFFRIATEHPESYFKQCNVCGRILPFSAFSKHKGWGPLERQMECRSCKGAINAVLNPKRTKEQLHESAVRRRIADLFVEDQNERIDIDDLFDRFDSKCFKTKKQLDKTDRSSWEIDHIMPSVYLYPLTKKNAALLSTEANNNKRAKWPSKFYTNSEIVELSRITGADLSLISSKKPIMNTAIDVNKGVERYLSVREHSNLAKRITELKKVIEFYDMVEKLTEANKQILGYI